MTGADTLRVLIVVALWGMNFVAIHVGLEGMPPLFLAAVRFFFSAFPAVFLLPRPDLPWGTLLGYGICTFGLQFGFLFAAMHAGVSPGLASLILQVQVFFTIGLGAWIFKEALTPWKLLGAAISFSGIAWVALKSNGEVSLVGLLLTVLAALSWAMGNMFSKKLGQSASLNLVIWGSFMALPVLTALSFAIEGAETIRLAVQDFSLRSLLAVAYIVYASTYVGYTVWVKLLNRYPTSSVAPFTLLVPVFGFLGSAAFLGERMPAWKAIASLLVVLGLLVHVFEARVRAWLSSTATHTRRAHVRRSR